MTGSFSFAPFCAPCTRGSKSVHRALANQQTAGCITVVHSGVPVKITLPISGLYPQKSGYAPDTVHNNRVIFPRGGPDTVSGGSVV